MVCADKPWFEELLEAMEPGQLSSARTRQGATLLRLVGPLDESLPTAPPTVQATGSSLITSVHTDRIHAGR